MQTSRVELKGMSAVAAGHGGGIGRAVTLKLTEEDVKVVVKWVEKLYRC